MRLLRTFLVTLLVTFSALAQMTPQQREFDFQAMLAVYAKRYGPANWKQQAIGVDIFDARPWMTRVRAAQSDVEYWQICAEFVASLQDGHSSYRAPASFSADAGLFADIYDGKVLVELINRTRYPAASFGFAVGDEIVSIDGRPVGELIDEFVKTRGYGNPRGARRVAADALVFRAQALYPKTGTIPDTSEFVFRKPDGTESKYTLTWLKRGIPATSVGPVPTPRLFSAPGSGRTIDSIQDELARPLMELQNWSMSSRDLLYGYRSFPPEESGGDVGQPPSKSFVLGWGTRNPYFSLPAGFNLRLGRNPADQFYSGTYQADGLRIGYLRIPHFGASPAVALPQLDAEIPFLRANTDGLIIDVTRNTGGGCIGLDYAARLIPQQFWFFGEHYRPTLSLRDFYQNQLELSRQFNVDQWIIQKYEALVNEFNAALKENRAMTGVLPACRSTVANDINAALRPATFENDPVPFAYDKPVIVLVDEFSISFGDIFPAMLQDNQRGPIVGMRTAGAGGSVSGWPTSAYSEAITTNTNSLVARRQPVTAPGLPTAALIENIGIVPDIELDYATRDNLMQGGRPYVDAFTRIMVEHIRKSRP